MRAPRPEAPGGAVAGPPGADRAALTHDVLLPVLVATAVLFGLLAPVHLLVHPPREGVLLAGVAAALSAAFAAGRVLCGRPSGSRLVHRHPDEVGLAAALLASLHSYALLLVTGEPAAAAPLMLFLVVVGALSQVPRYAAVVVLVGLVEWLSVAAAEGFRGEWGTTTVMVACAVVLAHLLGTARRRTADSLAAAQAAVLEAALTDELTGLTNRRGLLATGRAVLHRERTAPASLLFVDLDGLKRTNDEHGHAAGDALLRSAAEVLRAAVRPGDLVARLGGDEFAVLLDGVTARDAEHVRARLDAQLEASGVPASTGLAEAAPGQGLEALLADADAAMYAVKAGRRDRPAPAARPPAPRTAQPAPAWVEPDQELSADLADVTRVGRGLFLVLAPVHVVLFPGRTGLAVAALALGVALVLGAVRAVREHPRVRPRASLALAVCLGTVCLQTVAYVAVVGQAWASTAVLLSVVAAGALLRSRLQAAVVCGATVGGWALVAGSAGAWQDHAVHLATALGVSGVLHAAQATTVRRLTQAQLQARAVALTDELTGLSNRRGFLAAGRPLLELSLRSGRSATVLLLDLDGLKQVNDAQGHAAGDRLLATAAEVLRRATGPGDVGARLGGDEFSVLLHGCPPSEVPARVRWLERALEEARTPASIGVASAGEEIRSLEGLVDAADAAMYAVKRRRRAAVATG